jgi:hypothetical protein
VDFDAGEVLSRAWQITWRHKILWAFAALPVLPVLLFLPLILSVFLSSDPTKNVPEFLQNPNLFITFFVGLIVLTAISLVLRVFSNSATAFGVFQAEEGRDHLTSHEIANGGRNYFWRILGVLLLAAIGMMAFFAVFSACLSVVGIVTFGIGSAVGQLILLPIAVLFSALVEQVQAAIVADKMSTTDALARAWALMKEHIGKYAFLALLLYFGLAILSAIITLPVMLPLLLAVLSRFSDAFSSPAITWIAMSGFAVMLPFYLLFQAIAMLYMKSVYMVTYLRLTRSPKLQPLLANAGTNIVKESQ